METKFFYKVFVAFKGTNYLGWQIQTEDSKTVQGEFNKACCEIFKIKKVHTIGSGRTDTGVHSLGHVVKLEAPFFIENQSLKMGLNAILPKDIRVLDVEVCDEKFLPTNHAKDKTYKYLFTNNNELSPFQQDMLANCKYELDFELMKKACKLFEGVHDFSDFQCTGSDVSTTKREIYNCELYFNQVNMHGIMPDHWVFEVTGNGFLKQMIRLMIGTLWEIGRGKTTLKELSESLENPSGARLGPVAPAFGLYKISTKY